jgi:hypothetical protein
MREETAVQMTEFIHNFPQSAPFIADILVANLDWPRAEELAQRLKSMIPPQAKGGLPPEVEKLLQEGKTNYEKVKKENDSLKLSVQGLQAQQTVMSQQQQIDLSNKDMTIKSKEMEIQRLKAVEMVEEAAEMAAEMTGGNNGAQNPAPTINLGADIGEQMASALQTAFTQIPPLKVEMPPMPPPHSMKRTAVRGPNGLITHTIDEPIMPPTPPQGVPPQGAMQ